MLYVTCLLSANFFELPPWKFSCGVEEMQCDLAQRDNPLTAKMISSLVFVNGRGSTENIAKILS